MLQFFHDSELSVSNTPLSPKRFLCSNDGITDKISTLYIADTYQASLTATATSGATVLTVDKTDEFLSSGSAKITSGSSTYSITYTGKTNTTLTGVSGVSAALFIGDTVKPWKVYKTNGTIQLTPAGSDLSQIGLAIGISSGQFNYPGVTTLISTSSYDNTTDSPIPVYISVSIGSGISQEFVNWNIQAGIFFVRDHADSTAISSSEIGLTIVASCYLNRVNTEPITILRLLPNSRAIQDALPGFILGQYRWRDNTTENAQVLAATRWDPDVNAIGIDNFISGIARDQDLQLMDLENVSDSIYCRISKGFYFAGPERFYLPDNAQILFINATTTSINLNPSATPTTTIFVGVWNLDSNGFYNKSIDYRYQASGSFNTTTGAPAYQFVYSQNNSVLIINQTQPVTTYFLGTVSGLATDYFDLPVYPVDSIQSIYVDRGIGNNNLYSSNFIFDREQGTVSISSPSGTGNSIPGANKGEPIYAVCNPAFAIVYDIGEDDGILIDTVDLNPAYAGLSSGYLYLQHCRQKPAELILSADKPIIAIPPTQSSVIGLIAYGPIYFDGDYSLLTVQATGALNNEPISGATLIAVVGDDWSGTLNYQDPTSEIVTVVTGSDGKANLIYKPDESYGYTIPDTAASTGAGLATTTITNDTIVLPIPIAIDRIFDTNEGWLVRTYYVSTGSPVYGLVSGDPLKGELPFATSGTAGTLSYSTNGEKILWAIGTVATLPLDALDAAGHSYTNVSFDGNVVKLVYSAAVPSGSNVGAYFVTTIQRVTIQMQVENSDIISNTILLEMGLVDNLGSDWLIIQDSTQGRLNQYRLGR